MGSAGIRRGAMVIVVALGAIAAGVGPAGAASGQIVLSVPSGTTQSGFDVDGATMAPATAASTDVRTNTSTTLGYRQLVALNGAGVAKLGTLSLDGVSCTMLREATYTSTVFTGTDGTVDPVPGTVYAVRTFLNTYAKLSLVSIDMGTPKGLVLDFVTLPCPLDSTAPVITPSVTGPAGNGGWYIGHVNVSWTVLDPESPPTLSGCDDQTLTTDTASATITCSAASAGGSASESVTISVDQTDPVVAYDGNQGTYDIDEHIVIDCLASDQTSGIAENDCESVDAPAYTFQPGDHTLAATATDVAGHHGAGSTTFTVIVTPEGLIRLILQHVSNGSVASTLQSKIQKVADAPTDQARSGALGALRNYLSSKIGNGIDAATAALVSELAGSL